jgi:hypothetical protein
MTWLPDWAQGSSRALNRYEKLLTDIETGTRTDPEAVHDLAAWEVAIQSVEPASSQPLAEEATRTGRDTDLRRHISGNPKDMVAFCLAQVVAQQDGLTHEVEAAGHWYAMAARFARQAEAERQARKQQQREQGLVAPDTGAEESDETDPPAS